jgi:hypothetical protein
VSAYRKPPEGPRVLWEGAVTRHDNVLCRVVSVALESGATQLTVEVSLHADALGVRSWGSIPAGWHGNVVETLAAKLAEVVR